METVFARPGLTPEDVLATKKHTDAVLASSGEKVRQSLSEPPDCLHAASWVIFAWIYIVTMH